MELNKPLNCDCLEMFKSIPDNSIDCYLTDPPYNMAYTGRGAKDFASLENDSMDSADHTEWFRKIVYEMYRCAKENCHFYIWIDWRNYPRIYNVLKHGSGLEVKNCLVWDKVNFGMGQDYRYQHEFCIYATKGKPELYFDKKNVPNVLQASKDPTQEYEHPTQKPVYLMEMLIGWSVKDGIICDPFLGSGTTAVAAERLNKKWIGCEIMPEYYEVAKRRIECEQRQIKLF
jgi:DNA modification methylase